MQQLYSSEDIELVKKNWEKIMVEVQEERYLVLEPSYEESIEIHKIVLDFVKNYKRKIYGGFALHLLFGEFEKIYGDKKIPDVDIYSFDPLNDIVILCDILYEKGYKYILGREAIHKETYSLVVNSQTYCDITYVPKNIFARMPFLSKNDFQIIHPFFMTIDYLRMISDPCISYWRFGDDLKGLKRLHVLQKHYPLTYNKTDLSKQYYKIDSDIHNCIYKFMSHNKTTIIIGLYAYNYFLYFSGLLKDTTTLSIIDIPFYEFISVNYREDCLLLIEYLQSTISDITYKEYYPFFQYTDFSVNIYYKDKLIVKIYGNNNKRIPFIETDLCNFYTKKRNAGIQIKIGTFSVVLLYGYIKMYWERTNNNTIEQTNYYAFITQLISMRNYYFKKNDKTIFDDTLFKDFVVQGIGYTIQPEREKTIMIDEKKKQHKRYMFRYEPVYVVSETPTKISFIFSNTSGNEITNTRLLKLSSVVDPVSDEIDDDIIKDDDCNFIVGEIIDDIVETISDKSNIKQSIYSILSKKMTVEDIDEIYDDLFKLIGK